MQNFLPCKTPTRGGPLDGTVVSGGHSVTYEDPDAHLGHRPLVIRHHNMEVRKHIIFLKPKKNAFKVNITFYFNVESNKVNVNNFVYVNRCLTLIYI